MSEENVDFCRKQFEAISRGDWDVVAAGLDPHILVRTDPSWPEQHLYGREAVIEFDRSAVESLGSDNRIEEIVDLGDRVLIRYCWSTRGQHSGLERELRWSEIVTVREGRVVFAELFLDHDQALKAVGLEE